MAEICHHGLPPAEELHLLLDLKKELEETLAVTQLADERALIAAQIKAIVDELDQHLEKAS